MDHIIRAGSALKKYLAENKISQRAFAARVGVKQSIISRLASGKIKPGLDLAVSIESETNSAVGASMWAKDASKANGATQ